MEQIQDQLEELKNKIECCTYTLSMHSLSDTVHIEAIRDLLPEYIKDINKIIEQINKDKIIFAEK